MRKKIGDLYSTRFDFFFVFSINLDLNSADMKLIKKTKNVKSILKKTSEQGATVYMYIYVYKYYQIIMFDQCSKNKHQKKTVSFTESLYASLALLALILSYTSSLYRSKMD